MEINKKLFCREGTNPCGGFATKWKENFDNGFQFLRKALVFGLPFSPVIIERLSMTFTANGKNNSDFAHFFFST